MIDKYSAQRIKQGIHYTERVVKNRHTKARVTSAPQSLGCYAQITTEGGTSNTGKYSWDAIQPVDIADMSAETAGFTANREWGFGDKDESTNYAVEFEWQSKWVIKNDIVWLYPAKSQPYFFFHYNPAPKLAKINAKLSGRTTTAGSLADVDVMAYDPETTLFSTVQQITLYNGYKTDIGSDSSSYYVWITFNYGVWWALTKDCEAV